MPHRSLPGDTTLPTDGVWRVARSPDPLAIHEPDPPGFASEHTGSRFDSPTGNYSVLYFATDLRGCFIETLDRLRPDPRLAAFTAPPDWGAYVAPGGVPADWRQQRTAVRVRCTDPTARFLDIESAVTHRALEGLLGQALIALSIARLDVPTVRGPNRHLTRVISAWAYQND